MPLSRTLSADANLVSAKETQDVSVKTIGSDDDSQQTLVSDNILAGAGAQPA